MLICPGCGEENPPKFRLCGYCGAALAAAAPAPAPLPVREMRKTVTIVFSDLKDSTALGERIDTEALHEVKERYFSTMAAEIVRHGGKVEKYIGDAIMAVFGLPKAHEDDALRAVRAAHGMRVALDKLNEGLRQRYGVALANRTGINTGEVVANDDPTADQKLATGDAVNVAARLEQAAPVDQIYLGETTHRLVRAVHAILTQAAEERLSPPVAEMIQRLGGDRARRAGVDHPYHHRLHHRRRRGAAHLGGPLERGEQYYGRLDHHDPGVGLHRRAVLRTGWLILAHDPEKLQTFRTRSCDQTNA